MNPLNALGYEPPVQTWPELKPGYSLLTTEEKSNGRTSDDVVKASEEIKLQIEENVK